MSGEELKRKLETLDVSQAKLAELMGVFPQSFNKTLQADDVKSGFLEKLCQVLGKTMSFFYGEMYSNEDISKLRRENEDLKEELARLKEIKIPTKDSKVYNIWMKFMEITEEMQEMYNEEKNNL
jgi:transcriptional regulator with XRE-family HTH domain